MSQKDFSKLAVGDVIETRRTLRVTAKDPKGVGLADAQSGLPFHVTHGVDDQDSLHFFVVKKAAKPRPKVGDEITGEQLLDTQWKRNTVLSHGPYVYMLTSQGEWFSPAVLEDGEPDERDKTYSFEQLMHYQRTEPFKVEYLP